MFEQYPDVMSVEEVCEALRMGDGAVYDLLNSGRLKAFRNGRCWKIPRSAVEEYIKESAKLK